MELATITLAPDVVEQQLERYDGHEDRASLAIRSALEALQQGLMVVDLRTVFHAAMFENPAGEPPTTDGTGVIPGSGRRATPSVAIAPAARVGRPVRLTLRGTGELWFRSGLWRLRVPQDVRRMEGQRVIGRWQDRAPEIPPCIDVRPEDLVLWEATWSTVPRREFDPALLEHMGGWLFLVREVWDLTDVERGVLT